MALRGIAGKADREAGEPLPILRPVTRPKSFDPDAARQAWRQYARAGGARSFGMDLGRRRRTRWVAIASAGVVAAVAWMASRAEVDAPASPSPTLQTRTASVSPAEVPAVDPPAVPTMQASPAPAPAPVAVVAAAAVADPGGPDLRATAEPQAPAAIEVVPAEPTSLAPAPETEPTPPARLEQLAGLPRADGDRGPLGGVGPEALHIDRIALGTSHDRGRCEGHAGSFSASRDRTANVCFRAVHRRVSQQVVVYWEKNGQRQRRSFVWIPASHAFRTRAGLPLRKTTVGNWTVRVESRDGVELARESFTVAP